MNWINNTDPTRAKTFAATVAFLFLIVFTCTMMLLGVPVDHVLWVEMGTLIGAFAGVAYKTYSTERKTDYEYTRIQLEGQAKIAAAKAAATAPPPTSPEQGGTP